MRGAERGSGEGRRQRDGKRGRERGAGLVHIIAGGG